MIKQKWKRKGRRTSSIVEGEEELVEDVVKELKGCPNFRTAQLNLRSVGQNESEEGHEVNDDDSVSDL